METRWKNFQEIYLTQKNGRYKCHAGGCIDKRYEQRKLSAESKVNKMKKQKYRCSRHRRSTAKRLKRTQRTGTARNARVHIVA